MAFENVNIASLKGSINSCINTLNYNATNNIINNISNNNIWQTDSRNTLKKALETLKNTRYKNLKDYLYKCSTIAGYIEQYKAKEALIKSYQNQISSLNQQLAQAHADCRIYTICSGDTLSGIAAKYRINMYTIADINGFSSVNDIIYVGQKLLIPGPNTPSTTQLANQINSLKNKISQCRSEMANLESKVSNSI